MVGSVSVHGGSGRVLRNNKGVAHRVFCLNLAFQWSLWFTESDGRGMIQEGRICSSWRDGGGRGSR